MSNVSNKSINLTKREAERFVNVYNKHFGDATAAGAEFGMSREAFKRRLAAAEGQYGLKPKNFSLLESRAKLAADPDKAAAVNLLKERASHSYTKTMLKQTQADLEKLQKELSRYAYAAKASAVAADWTLKPRVGSKGEHMPVLLVSDAQVGEVVDADETEYGRGYNTQIFRERYRELVNTTIYLADKHMPQEWKFPGLIYIRGGDAISGGIHEELRETDDASPLESARIVFEEEAAGIRHLADFFGRVEVKSVAGGNHDRTTLKRRSKKRYDNYDALVDYMLAEHFKNDKRVTFQLTKSPDVVFPIFEKLALASHGDNIGSGGGTGFIGPVANIAKGVQKIMLEQRHLGRMIDHVFGGHFHTFHHCRQFTFNGSFPGYSEFAKSFRMQPEPPTQVFQIWHPTRGLVDIRPIVLK